MNHKILITTLSAAALSLGMMGSAHADQTLFVPLTLATGNGTLAQTGSFSDAIANAGSFTDDYIFANAPSFSLDTYTATVGSGVTFLSVTLSVSGTGTPIALNSTVTASSITASPAAVLPSALYVLEIKGIAAAASSYSGKISSTATAAPIPTPVPEPASWALMLAGLGLTGFMARRRRPAQR